MLKNVTVLYIEDDSDIAEQSAALLKKRVAALHIAKDGEQGLALFNEFNPDIIITDFQIPKLNGLAMIKKIREANSDIPVIITSPFNDSEMLLDAINSGVDACLLKPVNPQQLLKKVQQLVEPFFLKEKLLELKGQLKNIKELEAKGKKLIAYKERMEYAFTGSNDGLWDWNILTNDAYLSPRWKAIIGYKPEEIENTIISWKDSLHPEDLLLAQEQLENVFAQKTDLYEVEFRQKHKDGHWIWILARGVVKFDGADNPVRMIGTHTDITEKKDAEKRLNESQKSLAAAQKIAHLGSWTWKINSNDLHWSDEVFRIFGETPQSFEPTYDIFLSYLPEEDAKSIAEHITQSLEDKNKPYDVVHQIITREGEQRHVHETGNILYDSNDIPVQMIGTVLDVTDRIKNEKQLLAQKNALAHQVHHDALTGLPNRILFNDRLEHAITKAKRYKKQLAVFFIDLDHFKEINDSMGHDVGDEVLKIFAERLTNSARGEDTLARMGGDEFMLIMEDVHGMQSASIVADKIIQSVKTPISINGKSLYLTGSIGISFYPQNGEDSYSLIKNSDAAMYKAKDKGRNNYQFYTKQLTQLALERLSMESDLRHALEHEEFIVYYQPQIDALSNSITGMEALIRWHHPSKGLIAPGSFLPLAEETGLIVDIDRWVMKTALTQIQDWHLQGYQPGKIALNLSMEHLQAKDIIDKLQELIKNCNYTLTNIELEVTETKMMEDPEASILILQEISNMGISLAIDDFGTGYSSLSYLKKLPINKLKIDQSFVRDITNNKDASIIKAIIALAQNMNLEVISEGVETKEQSDFLVENGCHNIQGYFYAKPMPADKMKNFLDNGFI